MRDRIVGLFSRSGDYLPAIALLGIAIVAVVLGLADLNTKQWLVVATFGGPIIAVGLGAWLALWQFLRSREAGEVRTRYLDNGVSRFKTNIGELTKVSVINFLVACELWRLFKDYPRESPLAPKEGDIPRFLPINDAWLSFDAVSISQEVLGIDEVAKWSSHIFADTTIAWKEYESQFYQPLRAYYRNGDGADQFVSDRTGVLAQLKELMDRLNAKATRHLALFDILTDVEIVMLRRGLTRHRQIAGLRDDTRIKRMIELIREKYAPIAKDYEERMGGTP
jgi:hypothetical protein